MAKRDTGEVTPEFVDRPRAHRGSPPDFLEGEWDSDILSADGFAKILYRKLLRTSRQKWHSKVGTWLINFND